MRDLLASYYGRAGFWGLLGGGRARRLAKGNSNCHRVLAWQKKKSERLRTFPNKKTFADLRKRSQLLKILESLSLPRLFPTNFWIFHDLLESFAIFYKPYFFCFFDLLRSYSDLIRSYSDFFLIFSDLLRSYSDLIRSYTILYETPCAILYDLIRSYTILYDLIRGPYKIV